MKWSEPVEVDPDDIDLFFTNHEGDFGGRVVRPKNWSHRREYAKNLSLTAGCGLVYPCDEYPCAGTCEA